MKLVLLLLGAIALIILGARGTYKAVWNQFFPNEPIVTTPVSTVGVTGTPQQQQQGVATNPNEVGQQAAKTTQNWINSLTNGAASGSNSAPHVVPAPGKVSTPEVVGRTRSTIISTGVPDWWPSWLPYPSWFPHPGEGQTGKDMPTPGIMGGQ